MKRFKSLKRILSNSKFLLRKLKISMKMKQRYMQIYSQLKLFSRVNQRFKNRCTRWEYLKLWGMYVIGYQLRNSWASIIAFIIRYHLILNHSLSRMILLLFVIDGITFYNMWMSWSKSVCCRTMSMNVLFILKD
jgi:hypothetical protein